ncbi:MAG: SPASM domain-containing protein [Bdellovibrionales bacterium]|nr:SPASM domain-containing protein [Bdellovibrionales bacterium]
MSLNSSNKTLCSYFWKQIAVSSSGEITPCCRYIDDKAIGNINNNLEEQLNSESYKTLRRKNLKGERIEGCKTFVNKVPSFLLQILENSDN